MTRVNLVYAPKTEEEITARAKFFILHIFILKIKFFIFILSYFLTTLSSRKIMSITKTSKAASQIESPSSLTKPKT